MAENKWVSLGLFSPTYRGITPSITIVGAHLEGILGLVWPPPSDRHHNLHF